MKTTILLSGLLLAGLFRMRWSGIALIRDKRFFTFVPKTVADAVQPRHERFPGRTAWAGCWWGWPSAPWAAP